MSLQYRRAIHVLSLLFVGAFPAILALTLHATRLLAPSERLALFCCGFLGSLLLLELGCLLKVYATRLDVLSARSTETNVSPRGGFSAFFGYTSVLLGFATPCAGMWFYVQKQMGGTVPPVYDLVVSETGSGYGVLLAGLFLGVTGLLFGIFWLAASAAAASWKVGSGGGDAGVLTTLMAAPSGEDLAAYERSRGLR